MGIVIWYKVEFRGIEALVPPFPLTISNDVYNGSYIVDADIKLAMSVGATISTFEIKMTNLPEDAAMLLLDSAKGKSPFQGIATQVMAKAKAKPSSLLVEIHLGYFDDFARFSRSSPVMVGAVRSVKNEPNGEGLLETTVQGQEITGYRLRMNQKAYNNPGEIDAMVLVEQIARDAGVTVAPGSKLGKKLKDFTLKTRNGMMALEKLAEMGQVSLVVGDNRISIGAVVGMTQLPVRFDRGLNIVELADGLTVDNDTLEESYKSVALTVLGDPKLRCGQNALLVQGSEGPPEHYIITAVTHSFSTTGSGYICDLTLGRKI